MDDDLEWMKLALEEAKNGIGKTAPNPPVGAVIVKDGRQISSGWHRQAGGFHAEIEAIENATARHGPEVTKGATIYVTLEPCSTEGKTPACTVALIEAGFKKVVYACTDPNPDHAGAADAVLEKAGMRVISGVLEGACAEMLRPFWKVQKTGLPWVIWKAGVSLDGKITRPAEESQWLTSEASRADVQALRSEVDAIITSGETVRRDKPRLSIREPALIEGRPQPWRVILTERPDLLPRDAPLFTDDNSGRTFFKSGEHLEQVLRDLVMEKKVLSVMIEAGGALSSAFLKADLVDEAVVYLAPLVCGGTIPATGNAAFPSSLHFSETSWTQIGPDMRFRGIIQR